MNNSPENYVGNYGTPTVTEEPKKNVYTRLHAFFALGALAIGSLWYNWVFSPYNSIFDSCRPCGITTFTFVFSAFAVLFFLLRGARINRDAWIMLSATAILSLRYLIYPHDDYDTTAAVIGLFAIHGTALLFFRCIGNPNAFDTIVGDTAKAMFVDPFASFFSLFASFSAFFKKEQPTEEDRNKAKKLGYELALVLLGIFIAIPILCIVLSLLGSDGFFSDFLGDTADRIAEFLKRFNFDLFEYINPITVLVSLFIYGAMYSADKKRSTLPAPSPDYKFAPATVSKTIQIILLAVYVIFVIAQIDGFAHMFLGKLPEGQTYAEVARSGFFELCSVACINGAVLFYSDILTLQGETKKRTGLMQYLLTGFTLFLIATAATKMVMYICAYGFTPKRFYTTLFMLLLAVLFAIAIKKIRRPDFPFSRVSVYVVLAWLVLLLMVDYEAVSGMLNAQLGFDPLF